MPRNNKSICVVDLACQNLGASAKMVFKVPGTVLETLSVCQVWDDISRHGLGLPSSSKCDPVALSTVTQLRTQPGPCSAEYQTLGTARGNRPPSPSYPQSPTSSLLHSPSDAVGLLCTALNGSTQHLLLSEILRSSSSSTRFKNADLSPSPSRPEA